LLAAMRGPRHGRWLLALLPVAWLVGGVAGLTFPITASLGWATGLKSQGWSAQSSCTPSQSRSSLTVWESQSFPAAPR
jgi:hypothetical protein